MKKSRNGLQKVKFKSELNISPVGPRKKITLNGIEIVPKRFIHMTKIKTNEYHVDIKIYEPTSRQEFPYGLDFVRGLFGSDSDGTILKPGTFSLRCFMTPKEWEEFLDFGYSKGWMKIIGSELIAKGVAPPEPVLKEIRDLGLRDGIDINVDPS